MSVFVKELEPASERVWDDYVARHPKGTLFHTLIWRDSVEQAFGHESRYLTAWRDEALVGVFPVMRVTSCMAGTILVSVPYGVYGGTLADDEDAHAALLEHAQRLANALRARWLDIRSIEPQWPQLPVVCRYVTFRKQLPTDPARVLSELPRKARAAARQARERFALQVSFGEEHLETVWALYSQSMRRLASPNYPSRFFELLVERTVPGMDNPAAQPAESLSPNAENGPAGSRSHTGVGIGSTRRAGHLVQLVTYRRRPIAGLISFIYRDTLMPYFSGGDERYEKMHPNNFLYLTAMEEGVAIGCREFDFGRSRVDNVGSYNFKRFQGFEPTPLHYQYYTPKDGKVPDLHPGNRKLDLARRLWPKLPLAVTRPLGAWLAKSIPG